MLSLVRESGLTVLTALHDLNLAAAHCDLPHVIAGGRIIASGAPYDVLEPGLLESPRNPAAIASLGAYLRPVEPRA